MTHQFKIANSGAVARLAVLLAVVTAFSYRKRRCFKTVLLDVKEDFSLEDKVLLVS